MLVTYTKKGIFIALLTIDRTQTSQLIPVAVALTLCMCNRLTSICWHIRFASGLLNVIPVNDDLKTFCFGVETKSMCQDSAQR